MNGAELPEVRRRLGEMWSLGRPLRKTELGRCLGVPYKTIWRWESEGGQLQPTIERVIEAMLIAGYRPDYKTARQES